MNAVDFSPEGRLVAVASFDWQVTVLDVLSKQVVASLEGCRGRIGSQVLDFEPSGRFLMGVGEDTVRIWDTTTWRCSRQLKYGKRTGFARAASFSPDGRTLAVGDEHVVKLVDVQTGRDIREFPSHGGTASD